MSYTNKQLDIDLNLLEEKYKRGVHQLHEKWAQENKRFSIGDYIQCVVGIIKVESISYKGRGASSYVTYTGRRYKWLKGGYITPTNTPATPTHRLQLTLFDYTDEKIKLVPTNKVKDPEIARQ